MVLAVGRHSLARERRKSPIGVAALIAPAAAFFAAGADVNPLADERDTKPVVGAIEPAAATAPPCCVEIVAAAPTAPSPPPSVGQASTGSAPVRLVAASRWRVAASVPRLLPVGVAPERGLQVRTILAARAISAAFPEIQQIGGVRPDSLPWHPNGLAIDVMIPNPGTPGGIALGNEIVAFAFKNAARFGLQDAIWRGTYYTTSGRRAGGYGHYDHVHITTTGGGYPTGGEVFYR
jgi:hypothetical protein